MNAVGQPPPVLQVSGWERMSGLLHGFYGRRGGVSRTPYATLNVSRRSGDAPESVRENWHRVSAAVGGTVRFVTMTQVHGDRVVIVDGGSPDVGEADAMVSRLPGLALSVLTADCVPILLVAPAARVVAAVHAGWRGTLHGIVTRTVERMRDLGVEAAGIRAALGPTIGGCCYEVDRSIVDELDAAWGAVEDAARPGRSAAKAMLDLRAVNVALLRRAGVAGEQIELVGPCTKCAVTDYFSHRAAGTATGRQLSFVGWKE